jgi:predicted ABC-class ATPase
LLTLSCLSFLLLHVQSIEVGADTLLIDEDTCATNFMIRDDKMMQLVAPDKEPITPFVRIVRSLYDDCGISSILVIGGVGDYFDVADNVVVMDTYKCVDATERAKQIVANCKGSQIPHTASKSVQFQTIRTRTIVGSAFSPNGKVKVASQSTISYGETELDVSGLEQIVAKSQTAAISNTLQRLPNFAKENQSLREMLKALDARLNEDGLDFLAPGQFQGGMTRPRLFEIAGAINRLRRPNGIIQTR